MNEYEFVLRFQLPSSDDNLEIYLDPLFEAGCDDAVIGVGLPGYIALDFNREAENAAEAVVSAMKDVKCAIPGVKLTEAAPDLMNTTDMADFITAKLDKVTRQGMRKYAMGQTVKTKTRFPAAAVTCSSPLWHVNEVLDWLIDNDKVNSKREKVLQVIEISKTARAINYSLQGDSSTLRMAVPGREFDLEI